MKNKIWHYNELRAYLHNVLGVVAETIFKETVKLYSHANTDPQNHNARTAFDSIVAIKLGGAYKYFIIIYTT